MRYNTKIFTTSLAEYEAKRWEKQGLYEYYDRIVDYLERNLGEGSADWLARPKMSTGGDGKPAIDWYSHRISPDFSHGTKATGESALASRLSEVRRLITEIETTDKGAEWAGILSFLLQDVQQGFIASDGTTDVIAGWGMVSLSARSEGRYATDAGQTSRFVPPVRPEPAIPVDPESAGGTAEPPTGPESAETPDSEGSKLNEPHDSADPSQQDDPQRIPSLEEDNPPPPPTTLASSTQRRSPWWWLLLLALLVAAVLGYFMCGNSRGGKQLPGLPNRNIPIDTAEIGMSEDSSQIVVLNRINMMAKDSIEDFEAFARDFKAVYPDDNYRLIYYDTILSRLQLELPREDRERVMKELNEKLPQYELFIFPESMYESSFRPRDPGFNNSDASYYFDRVNAEAGWNYTYGSDAVVIAIVDDGLDLNHPEFADRIVKPINMISRTPSVYGGRNHRHGTHVAGTALGARNNRSGLCGIAPDCLIMPVQAADRNGRLSTTAIVDGVLYAIQEGAQVINLSLGKQFPDYVKLMPKEMLSAYRNEFKNEELLWRRISNYAVAHDVVLVIAAGNEDIPADIDPMRRSENVIVVSASNQQDHKASFSNYGQKTTVSAPGVDILSSVPGGNYDVLSGTSMASPIVAGAIGLARSINPSASFEDIKQALVETGTPLAGNIGPLLQIDAFLAAVTGKPAEPSDECDDIQRKIQELQQMIDALTNQCNPVAGPDTLLIPDRPKNTNFALGRWKSTSSLVNDSGESIVLYFTILPGGKGELTLLEPSGMRCSSNLVLQIQGGRELYMAQSNEATCRDGIKSYRPYTFKCQAEPNGVAICQAIDQQGQREIITFNLLRIN